MNSHFIIIFSKNKKILRTKKNTCFAISFASHSNLFYHIHSTKQHLPHTARISVFHSFFSSMVFYFFYFFFGKVFIFFHEKQKKKKFFVFSGGKCRKERAWTKEVREKKWKVKFWYLFALSIKTWESKQTLDRYFMQSVNILVFERKEEKKLSEKEKVHENSEFLFSFLEKKRWKIFTQNNFCVFRRCLW